MDAPPTGRIGRFLNVSSEVSGLAKVGPIRNHADTVQKVIRSPQTVVHFVTLLEEMPVQETLDGIAELKEVGKGGIQPGGIFVNMMRQVRPDQGLSDRLAQDRGPDQVAQDTEALEIALKARPASRTPASRSTWRPNSPRRPGLSRPKRCTASNSMRRASLAMSCRSSPTASTWPGSTGWRRRCVSRVPHDA